MQATTNVSRWSIAQFPSAGQRQEFLDQVRIWNRVEGFPRIETVPMNDGIRLRFFTGDPLRPNVQRLIEAFGGFVPRPLDLAV